ncbi:hypothetical protein Hanom_Chr11g00968531 [Helianthus anomalus]
MYTLIFGLTDNNLQTDLLTDSLRKCSINWYHSDTIQNITNTSDQSPFVFSSVMIQSHQTFI